MLPYLYHNFTYFCAYSPIKKTADYLSTDIFLHWDTDCLWCDDKMFLLGFCCWWVNLLTEIYLCGLFSQISVFHTFCVLQNASTQSVFKILPWFFHLLFKICMSTKLRWGFEKKRKIKVLEQFLYWNYYFFCQNLEKNL